jgi:CHAT domain-containing protein
MDGDDPALAARANRLTADLLDEVGGWLHDGAPALAEGGGELIIVPHRVFRDLPLLHARLPDGGRLGERFGSVSVAPTLGELVPELDAGRAAATERWSLADADGSLPFARCEALLAAPAGRCAVGVQVTRAAITEAFEKPGVLVLSLHGTFDEGAPLDSRIFAADGAVTLAELTTGRPIGAHTVVLGVCEAGRSRRSVSDEPWSFPALLLQQGARAVVAPAWPVDDLTSLLLVTRFLDELADAGAPGPALLRAAGWLRTLTAAQAGAHLDRLVERVSERGPAGQAAAARIAGPVDEHRAWFGRLRPADRPFGSPLDWAAFCLHAAGG